ncbi:exocyst complex component EXO84C, partial [Tanacetum coccineum]
CYDYDLGLYRRLVNKFKLDVLPPKLSKNDPDKESLVPTVIGSHLLNLNWCQARSMKYKSKQIHWWSIILESLHKDLESIVDQLTSVVILHFGGNILTRILQLFDQYMNGVIKALREPSEDDKELLPMVMSLIWSILNESKEAGGGVNDDIAPLMNNLIDYKDWRKQLSNQEFRIFVKF